MSPTPTRREMDRAGAPTKGGDDSRKGMTTLLLREKIGIPGRGVNTLVVSGIPSCYGGTSYEGLVATGLDRGKAYNTIHTSRATLTRACYIVIYTVPLWL